MRPNHPILTRSNLATYPRQVPVPMATAQEAHEMQCHSPQRTLCQLGFHTLNILESQSRRIRTRSQTLFIRTVARISSKTNRRLTEKPMDIPPLRNAPDRIP